MRYSYPQHKLYFYVAVGISFLSALYHLQEINKWLIGNVNMISFSLLLIQIFLIPVVLIMIGLYLRSIIIITDISGIRSIKPFTKAYLTWKDVKIIKRQGWSVHIQADKGSISFRPNIKSAQSPMPINPRENIFKHSELLKEIRLKAKDAKFENFPSGTF